LNASKEGPTLKVVEDVDVVVEDDVVVSEEVVVEVEGTVEEVDVVSSSCTHPDTRINNKANKIIFFTLNHPGPLYVQLRLRRRQQRGRLDTPPI